MRRVADQVRPPFVDLENAICSSTREAIVLPDHVQRAAVVVDRDLRDQISGAHGVAVGGVGHAVGDHPVDRDRARPGVALVGRAHHRRGEAAVLVGADVADQVEQHHQIAVRQHHDLIADRLRLVARVEDRLDHVVRGAVVVRAREPRERAERGRPHSRARAGIVAGRDDPLPRDVDESRVGRIRRERLLVVEEVRAVVELDHHRVLPVRALVERARGQHGVGEVRVVDRTARPGAPRRSARTTPTDRSRARSRRRWRRCRPCSG